MRCFLLWMHCTACIYACTAANYGSAGPVYSGGADVAGGRVQIQTRLNTVREEADPENYIEEVRT